MNNNTTVAQDETLFCREDVYGCHYYKNVWEKIEDNHYPECPVSISARQQCISTCCMCDVLKDAKTDARAEECLRCHNLADDCKCGMKAQLV